MRSLLLLLVSLQLACCMSPLPGRRPCWKRIQELDDVRDPDGNLPPGGEDPDCDAQGLFKPKQCRGSQCFCVNPKGEPLPSSHTAGRSDYTKNRWEADDMACNCAVEEAAIVKDGKFGPTIDCDDQGDYHHTQCLGTSCYCVHRKTGVKSVGTDSNIVDFDRLEQRCAAL